MVGLLLFKPPDGGGAVRYVMSFANGRRGPELEGVTRESVSEECREAALHFMAGVAGGWDKVDLALWLTGPYSRATRHAKRGERCALAEASATLRAETIEDLLVATRGRLIAALEKAALGDGSLEFTNEVVTHGLVRRAIGEDGRELWIPLDIARLRLRDRLRALFAADYLNSPDDYASLYVCHRCEAVAFDERARKVGFCAAHGRISGFAPRDDEAHDEAAGS